MDVGDIQSHKVEFTKGVLFPSTPKINSMLTRPLEISKIHDDANICSPELVSLQALPQRTRLQQAAGGGSSGSQPVLSPAKWAEDPG